MKKNLLILCATIMTVVACTTANEEQPQDDEVTVSLGFKFQFSEITRAELSDASTYLDVWVVSGDDVVEVHQTKTDDDFGNVTFSLNRNKTYSLYAVAHKGNGAASLSNGIISFVDTKISDTFWYSTSFSPATTTDIDCAMNRIVGQFRVETTDAVPSDVKKMRFTIANTFTQWAVSGVGAAPSERIVNISITSTAQDGTVSLNMYIIGSATTSNYNIHAEALSATDEVLYEHQFTDIPIQNNYKTVVRGNFFVSPQTATSFTANAEWQTFNTISF